MRQLVAEFSVRIPPHDERIDRLRALPAGVHRVRLVAPDADGERLLAEYTFIHTSSSHQ